MGSLQNQIQWYARAQWTLGVFMTALVLCFYFLAYRPILSRQVELNACIQERTRELDASRQQTRILPDVASEVERLRARLERSRKRIPAQLELPQFIKDVTQLSQQSRLAKFSFKPGAAARGGVVSELPIQLNFEGDFVNVFSFLRNSEEMPRLTRVRGVNIKSRDKSGQVQVTLTMNIYFGAD
jgi:Tfp pilus assembly protein PilO